MILKLKIQYFDHLTQSHWKRPLRWERLKAKEVGLTEDKMVK